MKGIAINEDTSLGQPHNGRDRGSPKEKFAKTCWDLLPTIYMYNVENLLIVLRLGQIKNEMK